MRTIAATAVVLAACSTATADPPPDAEVLACAAGSWEGSLFYLDDRSGDKVELPATATIEVSPDGAQVTSKYALTDPSYTVHLMDVACVDPDSGHVVTVFFSGGAVERREWRVVSREFESETEWTIVLEGLHHREHEVERMTRTVRGERLASRVDELDTSVDPPAWRFANELRVRRVQSGG